MLHGDISNQRSFNIGFRCENTLLIPKEGALNAVSNLVKGKWLNADIDEYVLSTMNDIYWNTEYTVSLIVDDKTLEDKRFREYIEDFPFNSTLNVLKSPSEITMWLNTGLLTFYVTNDIIEKSRVNSKYCMNAEDFNKKYKRKGRPNLYEIW